MARGDKADLFFRKLRSAGLSKPAVQTLAERLDALEAADSAASGALHSRSKLWAASDIAAGISAGSWVLSHANANVTWDGTGTQAVVVTGGDYDVFVGGSVASDGTKDQRPVIIGVYPTGTFADMNYSVVGAALATGDTGSYTLNDIRRMYLPAGTTLFLEDDSPAPGAQLSGIQFAMWLVQADDAVPLS